MSILNVFVTPESALVGVDTEAVLPDGSLQAAGKMVVIPHLGAVAGFRGLDLLMIGITASLVCFKSDFDDLAKSMPKILGIGIDYARNQPETTEALLADFEVVLAGYSPTLGRITANLFACRDGVRSDILDLPEAFYAPSKIAGSLSPGFELNREGMIELAQKQREFVRNLGDSRIPAGGRFIIAELDMCTIKIEHVLNFAD